MRPASQLGFVVFFVGLHASAQPTMMCDVTLKVLITIPLLALAYFAKF